MAPSLWTSTGTGWRNLVTGELRLAFMPGVSMPSYVETVDFSGARNVGTNPTVALVPYAGTVTNGIAQITDGALYENVLFSSVVEVRSAATFRNCRFVLPKTYTQLMNVQAIVQILNGTGAQNILFEDCEIHNRAQRPVNGIMGRNFTMRRSVVTGCVDAWAESSSGSAPNTGFGFVVEDCIAPSVAWWFSPTSNSEIHNQDTGSHSDVMQKNTTLSVSISNTVFGAYVSELIGTGTPGSGSDAGNTYSPQSGYDFTQSQAQMEAWRTANANTWTTPAQSMFGTSRRLATAGSLAGVMLNLGNISLNRCYFGGGSVGLNAVDPDVDWSTVSITNCVFWNDMMNGHVSGGVPDPTRRGHAILGITGRSFQAFTANVSMPTNAALARTEEGGFSVWR